MKFGRFGVLLPRCELEAGIWDVGTREAQVYFVATFGQEASARKWRAEGGEAHQGDAEVVSDWLQQAAYISETQIIPVRKA